MQQNIDVRAFAEALGERDVTIILLMSRVAELEPLLARVDELEKTIKELKDKYEPKTVKKE